MGGRRNKSAPNGLRFPLGAQAVYNCGSHAATSSKSLAVFGYRSVESDHPTDLVEPCLIKFFLNPRLDNL